MSPFDAIKKCHIATSQQADTIKSIRNQLLRHRKNWHHPCLMKDN